MSSGYLSSGLVECETLGATVLSSIASAFDSLPQVIWISLDRPAAANPRSDGFANAHFADHIDVGAIALDFGVAVRLRHVDKFR